MSSRLPRAALACATLGLILASPVAQAYVRETTPTGRSLYWDRSRFPIAYSLDNSPSGPGLTDNRTVVKDEFAIWEAAACADFSVTTTPNGIAHTSAREAGDNVSTIFWSGTCSTCWTYGSGVLGVTTPWFNSSTGEISEADMIFNAKDWTWPTPSQYASCTSNGCADTASIALHEEGHFLGLDHSASRSAVMYASWDGSAKRTLTSDDVAGICAIYPTSAQGTGSQGVGCTASSQCVSTLVCGTASTGGASICTRTCTGTSDGSCPSGYTCQAKAGGGFGCFTPPSNPNTGGATEGQGCSASVGCATNLVCASSGAEYTCHKTCIPGGTNTCPSGQACYDFGDGTGGCFSSGSSGGTTGLGGSCTSQESCQSGLICVGTSVADATCRQKCGSGIGGCPTGQNCVPLSGASSGACYPGSSNTGTVNECQACSTSADCKTGLTCVAGRGGTSICRRACETDNVCGTSNQCIPSNTSGVSSVCACAADIATADTGQRCVADKYCKTGRICVDDGSSDGPVCRVECDPAESTCNSGLICKEFDAKSACVSPDPEAPDAGSSTPIDPDVRTVNCNCTSGGPAEFGLGLMLLAMFGARRRRFDR